MVPIYTPPDALSDADDLNDLVLTALQTAVQEQQSQIILLHTKIDELSQRMGEDKATYKTEDPQIFHDFVND